MALLDSVRAWLAGTDRHRYQYQALASPPLRPTAHTARLDADGLDLDEDLDDDHQDHHDPTLKFQRHRERAHVGSVWSRSNRRLLKLTLVGLCAAVLLYLGAAFARVLPMRRPHSHPHAPGEPPESCDTVDHGYQCYPAVAQSWGQYAPFFSVSGVEDGTLDPALPPTCRYTFAQVLSRHGARDPTAGKSIAYAALLARITGAGHRFVDGPDGRFAFLNDYAYRLGADELTRFGEHQMANSGAHFYRRYRSLLAAHGGTSPFVRAADQHRVVLSGVFWLEGFERARAADADTSSDSDGHKHMLLLPEARGFNNTLSYNGLCTRFTSRRGNSAQRTFLAAFAPPITARLNRGLPGANLTDDETVYLMDLCPFETVADLPPGAASDTASDARRGAEGGRQLSPFCHLFSDDEWRSYDYYQTLGKWYGFGDGSDLGATQGVGFANELVARLTQTPVVDHTSTNRTLDADPATFPLNATVYADFSHDNDMANVFAALGLFAGVAHPSNTSRTPPAALHGFAASWVVPFGARMYVEKMVCDDSDDSEHELVRVLVNDRVVPLQNCSADALGRCRVDRFVDSLEFARRGGNWDDCFA